jgi:hypothetical protein
MLGEQTRCAIDYAKSAIFMIGAPSNASALEVGPLRTPMEPGGLELLLDLELPGAVLGVLEHLDARLVVAKHQDRLAILFAGLGLAPLALE